ncbi:glycosyltransferase [Cohaesibacter marisflavi]|uniref:glycosyltransferase n=1 Tax=Cohaesibacter marisflavi TaxID=655353 RepID=UPI0029C62A70|nr:glycosyltransferase [Cohaesibacter marisflavi]
MNFLNKAPDPAALEAAALDQAAVAYDEHGREWRETPQSAKSVQPGLSSEAEFSSLLPFHLSILDSLQVFKSPSLQQALKSAAQTGDPLIERWTREGKLDETLYFACAAKRLGVPFVAQPSTSGLYPLPDNWPLEKLRDLSWILIRPFAKLDHAPPVADSLYLCAPHGKELDALAEKMALDPQFRQRVRITTPRQLRRLQRASASKAAMDHHVFRLKQTMPDLSAHGKFKPFHSYYLAITLIALIGSSLVFSSIGIGINLITIMIFLTMSILRLISVFRLPHTRTTQASRVISLLNTTKKTEASSDWPSYSVFVPLFREGRVVPDLIQSLCRLDYPRDRLTCYLLLEEEDEETRAALAKITLPAFIELVDIPKGGPQTKPKALNYALSFVQSDLTVIYDAEDRPDPHQLKIAALHMLSGRPSLACLQAQLAVDNARTNFLTRQFAVEYSALFDGLLPFLAFDRLVVPLGGTSNHFKTRVLKQIGGWDPYNVTEDADLGLRLSRLGYDIETIRSDTWEEAPESYAVWLKQRTRWFKGWMQTWIVHMRRPCYLYRKLGSDRFFSFHIMIGSMLLSTLVHPLYFLTFGISAWNLALYGSQNGSLFFVLLAINSINLVLGYGGVMVLGRIWAGKRYGFGWRAILEMPLYWLLMTPAAWRALYQLIHDPHHWEKTDHGLSSTRSRLPHAKVSSGIKPSNMAIFPKLGSHFKRRPFSMRRDPSTPKGTLQTITVSSKALENNLLGDSCEREVIIYTPHGHDGAGLPLLVDLVGFTAGGPAHVNWKNFGENVPERLDRLIASGEMPPAVVAFPDCFTRLGGNQYVNSAALGNWEDFLIEDMTPAIETQIGCGGSGKRGLFGKSSGGYGSILHAMKHADFWSAAACLSGDMAFELCYLPDMPNLLRALAKKNNSIERFLTEFEEGPKYDGKDIHALMTLAMAASYDPDPDSYFGIRLPVNMHDCSLIQERWANWLEWDPVVLADQPAVIANLKSMKGLWLECGYVDQYNLLYGARRLHSKLEAAGVDHVYEEFPDNHSSIDYRMDVCLPYLVRALEE